MWRKTRGGNEKQRWYHLKRKYQIEQEEWERLFKIQKGRCALCFRHQSEFKRNLNIDHDHKTGEIRGLLCSACNRLLGTIGDSIGYLERAIDYLNFSKRTGRT